MERIGIEISFPIELTADLNILVNVSDKVELAYIRFADDCIRVDPTTTIFAILTGPEMGAVDPSRISVYDPEAA